MWDFSNIQYMPTANIKPCLSWGVVCVCVCVWGGGVVSGVINKPYMYISPSADKKALTAKIAKNSGLYETTSIMGDHLLCGFIELRESTYT